MIRTEMLKRIRTLFLAATVFPGSPGLSAPPPPAPQDVDAAVQEMSSADFETREAAFARLLDWGARHPKEALELLPAEMADPEVASRCAQLREKIEWAAVRLAAIEKGAKEPGLPGAIDAFLAAPNGQALNDLRSLAVRLGDPDVSDACCSVIAAFARRDGDPRMRAAALNTLVILADRRAIEIAAAWLPGDDFPLRQAAANALRSRGGREHAPLVLAALESPGDLNIRTTLLDALGRFGDPATIPVLVRELKRETRQAAARALGAMKAREQAPAVAEMLKHPNAGDRMAAAQALGMMGDPAQIPALEALLSDPEPGVRNAAEAALRQIGDPKTE